MALEVVRRQSHRIDLKRLAPYADNPLGFVHDCISFPADGPSLYQDEALANLGLHHRAAVWGPHGLGKTALAAWVILWGVLTSDDVKIPTTASAWRQLTKFLWPEVHKWSKHLRWDKIGRPPFTDAERLDLSLKLSPTCEAFAVASNNADLIEGAHAARVIYVYDEAKAIPDKTWDASEGAFSTGEAFALAISTPGPTSGRFYDICSRRPGYEDWWTRHVTKEEAIEAGRISAEWVEQRRRQWGEDSPVYQCRVEGNFASEADDTLVRLEWLERARNQSFEIDGRIEPQAGADIARFGSDDSCLLVRQGQVVLAGEVWHGSDVMESTGRIKARGIRANVDEIGVGSGVVDRLRELKFPVLGINVSTAAIDDEHFYQRRDELYFNLRELFRDGNIDLSRLSNEIYDRLSGELVAIQFSYMSTGKIKIESKADMKKRMGHSPDVADALALAFIPKRIQAKVVRLG
jgi:hypothetical protein